MNKEIVYPLQSVVVAGFAYLADQGPNKVN